MEPEVRELALSFKDQVEDRFNKKFTVYEPEEFSTQVVAGTNYKIEIRVGGDQHITIEVFKPLLCQNKPPELTGIEAVF